MLTLFTTPKPFNGHFGIIQRNAILSWKALKPQPEIILFGDDKGVEAVAKGFGVRHIGDIACNESGTPFVYDLFKKAQDLAVNDILCYVNADIILMQDFMASVQEVASLKSHFLMVGQRWNLNIAAPLDLSPDWESMIRKGIKVEGRLEAPCAIDYLVFPKGLYSDIPPFVIGRPAWDNWMLYHARSRRAILIDATKVATAIHQNHDYSHHPCGRDGVFKGAEAANNLKLARGWVYFTIKDSTHILTCNGLKNAYNINVIRKFVNTVYIYCPAIGFTLRLLLVKVKYLIDRLSLVMRPEKLKTRLSP